MENDERRNNVPGFGFQFLTIRVPRHFGFGPGDRTKPSGYFSLVIGHGNDRTVPNVVTGTHSRRSRFETHGRGQKTRVTRKWNRQFRPMCRQTIYSRAFISRRRTGVSWTNSGAHRWRFNYCWRPASAVGSYAQNNILRPPMVSSIEIAFEIVFAGKKIRKTFVSREPTFS